MTPNALVHVQAARSVSVATNGWAVRLSDLTTAPPGTHDFCLEGAECLFVGDTSLFLVLRDGIIVPVDFVVEGKTISTLTIKTPLAQASIPAVARAVACDYVFIGSIVGASVLLKKVVHVVAERDDQRPATPSIAADEMDFDDAG